MARKPQRLREYVNDVSDYVESEGLKDTISEEYYEDILSDIEGAYDFSGCGYHGWELIDHIAQQYIPIEDVESNGK